MGIFFAAAIWHARNWLRNVVIASCAVLFLGTTALSLFTFHQSCDSEDRVSGMLQAYRSREGFEGVDEYTPPHADNTLVAVGLPDACLSPDATAVLAAASSDGTIPEWDPANGHCDATYSWIHHNGTVPLERRRITADIPQAGFLILRLREYAPWQVRVNGRLLAFGADPVLPPLPHRDDGLMAVPVPQGHVELSVDFAATRDVIIGRWISALSLLLLGVLYFTERRLSRVQR